jgi:hypothetical protein
VLRAARRVVLGAAVVVEGVDHLGEPLTLARRPHRFGNRLGKRAQLGPGRIRLLLDLLDHDRRTGLGVRLLGQLLRVAAEQTDGRRLEPDVDVLGGFPAYGLGARRESGSDKGASGKWIGHATIPLIGASR